jgi:hypothetical protein
MRARLQPPVALSNHPLQLAPGPFERLARRQLSFLPRGSRRCCAALPQLLPHALHISGRCRLFGLQRFLQQLGLFARLI